MKKAMVILAMALALTACSSGVDQATHDAVVKENNELKEKIVELEEEVENANAKGNSSLNEVVDRYIAEADRDAFWIDHLVDSCKTIMEGNDDSVVITIINASSDMQKNLFDYKAKLLVAGASDDEKTVESLHDTWVSSMQRFSDSFKTVYETLNEAISVHY